MSEPWFPPTRIEAVTTKDRVYDDPRWNEFRDPVVWQRERTGEWQSAPRKKYVLAANRAHYLRYLEKNKLSPREAMYVSSEFSIRGIREGIFVYLSGFSENREYDSHLFDFISSLVVRGNFAREYISL